MNPFLIILILLGAVILWFLLTFLFEPVGKIVSSIIDDTLKTMNEESEEKENE